MRHGRDARALASPGFPLLLAFASACGDSPVPLPKSAPLPADEVNLKMTFRELSNARPGAVLIPDTGVVELLTRSFHRYGFTSNPPRAGSRLVYVDHVMDRMDEGWARREWETLVEALATEMEMEPRCAEINHARLRWRRALLEEEGSPVAAAVEVVAVTTGDPGPGEAELVTRVWLTEHASPVSRFLEGPEGAGAGQLQWEDCGEDASPGDAERQ